MFKLMFVVSITIAMIVAIMTATASAHIWNRPAPQAQATLRISPCPVSYDFKRGFCVKGETSTKAWFSRAIGDIL